MKKGFTLVELSIVLVIIGLLVGGILVGQSLIESAKLSSFVASIGKHDAAIGAFEAKYRGLPGDNKSFGGNGDGYIGRNGDHGGFGCVGPSRDGANMLQGEIANFWSAIYPSNYLRSPYAPNSGQGAIRINNNPDIKKYLPMPNFGTNKSFLYVAANGVDGAVPGTLGNSWCLDNVNPRNYYVLASPDYYSTLDNNPYVLAGAAVGKRAAKVVEMMGLDSKMDDSNPAAGNVRAGRINWTGYNGAASTGQTNECSSGATYLINNKGYECTPLIRVGAQSGNLK